MNAKIMSLLAASLMLVACGQAPSPVQAPHKAAGAIAAKNRVYTLEDMGVGKTVQKALSKAGISNSTHMLEAARTDYLRETLTEQTGVAPEKVLELVHMADLMRVPGVGPVQARLLMEAGVTTALDLARRNPFFLQADLNELNGLERLTERTPSAEVVLKWVEAAKTLERVVEF